MSHLAVTFNALTFTKGYSPFSQANGPLIHSALVADGNDILDGLEGIACQHDILDPARDFAVLDLVSQKNIDRELAIDGVALAQADHVVHDQSILDAAYHFLVGVSLGDDQIGRSCRAVPCPVVWVPARPAVSRSYRKFFRTPFSTSGVSWRGMPSLSKALVFGPQLDERVIDEGQAWIGDLLSEFVA